MLHDMIYSRGGITHNLTSDVYRVLAPSMATMPGSNPETCSSPDWMVSKSEFEGSSGGRKTPPGIDDESAGFLGSSEIADPAGPCVSPERATVEWKQVQVVSRQSCLGLMLHPKRSDF